MRQWLCNQEIRAHTRIQRHGKRATHTGKSERRHRGNTATCRARRKDPADTESSSSTDTAATKAVTCDNAGKGTHNDNKPENSSGGTDMLDHYAFTCDTRLTKCNVRQLTSLSGTPKDTPCVAASSAALPQRAEETSASDAAAMRSSSCCCPCRYSPANDIRCARSRAVTAASETPTLAATAVRRSSDTCPT